MQLKGTYANNVTYSVGDVVKYSDNHVYHLQKPAKAGTDCHNTLFWQKVDQFLEEAILMILDGVGMAEGGALDGKVANNLTTTASGKVLDARQGKTLKGMVDDAAGNFADEYDSTSTYSEGDYCIHDRVWYKANTDIGTAEAWTAAHWTEVGVADEIIALLTKIEGYFPTSTTLVLASSTAASTKTFAITVDDSGELTATEITALAET